MGLDDLGEKEKEEVEQDEVEELADKLDVDNLDELRKIDDRMDSMVNSMTSTDKEIEQLKQSNRILATALARALDRISDLEEEVHGSPPIEQTWLDQNK